MAKLTSLFYPQVEVDIDLSAHANARRWFEQKKKHAVKQDKTMAAHEKAFKAAEKKTQQQLAQVHSSKVLPGVHTGHCIPMPTLLLSLWISQSISASTGCWKWVK